MSNNITHTVKCKQMAPAVALNVAFDNNDNNNSTQTASFQRILCAPLAMTQQHLHKFSTRVKWVRAFEPRELSWVRICSNLLLCFALLCSACVACQLYTSIDFAGKTLRAPTNRSFAYSSEQNEHTKSHLNFSTSSSSFYRLSSHKEGKKRNRKQEKKEKNSTFCTR